MRALAEVSLLGGAFPLAVTALGAAGALYLLLGRARRFRTVALPVGAAVTVAVTGTGYVVVEKIWRPFPDPIEGAVYLWIGAGVAALVLGVPRVLTSAGARARVASVLAVLMVIATAAVQVNLVFASYPTLGSVFGRSGVTEIAFSDVPGPTPAPITGLPLESAWTDPGSLPTTGRVTTVAIPGVRSGFAARDAKIYLPPAYFASPRPLLPLLVMLAGQPGSPQDWLVGGKLASTMDRFAAAHEGLAPVVLIADGTGSEVANPLCVDSPLGNMATYLAVDVPDWAQANLQIDPNRSTQAIGGLSYGATCALQMATNHPDVYPTFLSLSGQLEPTLGDRARTLAAAFGGDEKAFEAVNPIDLMARQRFPQVSGAFVVGSDDRDYQAGVRTLLAAAQAAGMTVRYQEERGGHDFGVWSAGLASQIDFIAQRMGIVS